MKRIIAFALALALGLGCTAALALSWRASEPDSAFTAAGGGAEALVRDATSLGLSPQRLLSGPLGLASDAQLDAAKTLLVVVEPRRTYSAAEVDAARAFMLQGGRILVADAFGDAGSLTAPFGIAFERVRLVEPSQEPVTHLVDGRPVALRLGRSTALHLDPTAETTGVVLSSADSFLDRDGDGLINASDPRGPFPLLAGVAVGSRGGTLLAVADPSLLSPGPVDDNGPWRRAVLLDLLPEGGRVAIDESHPRPADPILSAWSAAVAAARTPVGAWVLGGLAALMLAGAAIPAARDEWGRHQFRPHRFVRRGASNLANPAVAAPPVGGSGWTRRGVAAVGGAPALAILSLVLGHEQMAWAAALLAVAAASALLPGPPAIAAVRHLSSHKGAEEAPITVEVEFEKGGPAMELEILDRVPAEFEVREGSNWFRTRLDRAGGRIPYTVVPALRGPYQIGPLAARRIDPLHLHVRQALCETPERVEVAPRREKVNKVPFGARVPTVTLGPHMVNRAGEGSEFHSLREYHDGDAFRSINWKASARSTQLVVTQRVHESRTTVTIFLDARAVSGAGPAASTPLAQAARAAYSLAAGALQVRDRVRFVSYGAGVSDMAPAPASRQLHLLLHHLAGLGASGTTTFRDALDQVLPTLKPGTPALVLSGLEGDDTVVEGVRLLGARGLLPIVIAPPLGTRPVDPADGDPEPEAASIEAQRSAAVAGLRAAGVPVFETVPGVPLDYLFRLGVSA